MRLGLGAVARWGVGGLPSLRRVRLGLEDCSLMLALSRREVAIFTGHDRRQKTEAAHDSAATLYLHCLLPAPRCAHAHSRLLNHRPDITLVVVIQHVAVSAAFKAEFGAVHTRPEGGAG